MWLTLPSVEPARVASAACAVIAINGQRFSAHAVSEAVHVETPLIEFSHCTACGCLASDEVRKCQESLCPGRVPCGIAA